MTQAERALMRGIVGAQRALGHRSDGPAAYTLRALEMAVREWRDLTGLELPTDLQLGELPRLPAPAPRPEPKVVVDARARFSGESCRNCGGVRLRRSGSCLVCEDCGESGGCS